MYANHAKKKLIDLEDVRLAVQMQVDRTFTSPPPRDVSNLQRNEQNWKDKLLIIGFFIVQ